MSVANQANEKLTQLVTLTAKIEGYLNPNNKGKGKGEKGETSTQPNEKGQPVGKDITKESTAIAGMSTSLVKLIKAAEKVNPNAGNKLKKFLVNLSDGITQAAEAFKQANVSEFIKDVNTLISAAAKWSLAMIAIGIVAPLVAIGTLVFSLSVKAAINILSGAGAVKAKTQDSITAILSMAKGAALFALAMVSIALVAPLFAIGVLVFSLSVKAMLAILGTAGGLKAKTKDSINFILSLARGAALFALTMVGIALVSPLFAMGVLVFTLAVSAMILVFSLLTAPKSGTMRAINMLMKLGASIALFALTMVGLSFVAPQFAMGVLVFTLSVGAMIMVFSLLTAPKSGTMRAINMLMKLGSSIAIFALVMIGVGYFYKQFALGALVVTLSIAALLTVFAIAGKFSKEINKGIKSVSSMILPIAGLSAILFLAGLGWKQIALGGAVVAGAIVVLGLATYVLGNFNKQITKGVAVLYELAPALILFSVAMFILAAAPASPAELALKLAAIGGAIVVLGLAAYVLGLPAVFPFAMLGAEVLVALSIPLILFSAALFILSKAKFDKDQADNLGYVIKTLGKSTALLGLLIVPILLGSIAMLPMALALSAITPSLKTFKEIGWEDSDSESLKSAMQGVVQAYVGAFAGVGFLKLLKLMAVIPLIGKMGTSLTSLAAGIKAMATLTFIESEYDEKTGKLVPKREVKLTNAEIQAVGPNVAAILSALAAPLTMFGMWADMGSSSGFFGIGGSSGYMAKGIEASAKIGNILVSLAKGVADMANLEVVEYEVVGKGTKDAKLVPKGSRKLTQADFTLAGAGVSAILSALTIPLLDFGKAYEKGSGWFTDGYLQKGIDAAKGISDFIVNLATGVAQMATLEVVEYEVVGKGTKDAKLVPKGSRKLNENDFVNAGTNVSKLLGALAKPLTDFGRAFTEGEGWFSDGYMEDGIEAIAMLSDPLAKLAKTIVDMAAGQATINEVIDGKIVPKSMISFSEAIPQAQVQVSRLLNALAPMFVQFGQWYDENEDAFDDGIDAMDELQKGAEIAAKVAVSYVAALTELDKTASLKTTQIWPFMKDLAIGATWIGWGFKEGRLGVAELNNYDKMVTVTQKLSSIVSPFEKFVKAFGIFAKDMGVFTKNFNVFGKDDAANFKVMGDVVDKVSKIDVGKLKAALTALNEYAAAEEKVARERQQREASGGPSGSTLQNTANNVTNTAANAGKPPAQAAPAPVQKIQIDWSNMPKTWEINTMNVTNFNQ